MYPHFRPPFRHMIKHTSKGMPARLSPTRPFRYCELTTSRPYRDENPHKLMRSQSFKPQTDIHRPIKWAMLLAEDYPLLFPQCRVSPSNLRLAHKAQKPNKKYSNICDPKLRHSKVLSQERVPYVSNVVSTLVMLGLV